MDPRREIDEGSQFWGMRLVQVKQLLLLVSTSVENFPGSRRLQDCSKEESWRQVIDLIQRLRVVLSLCDEDERGARVSCLGISASYSAGAELGHTVMPGEPALHEA